MSFRGQGWNADEWASALCSLEPTDSVPGALVAVYMKSINEALISKMCTGPFSARPLVGVSGHLKFDGFYIVTCIDSAKQTMTLIPSSDNNGIWSDSLGIVLEHGNHSNFKIITERPSTECGGTIFVAAPLLFHCRSSVFGLDQVDTVNQTFEIDFYKELRLRDVVFSEDVAVCQSLMQAYGLSYGLIDFLNVSEVVREREVWDSTTLSAGRYTYIIKMRQKCRISEQMELENFPFDIQEMNVTLTFNASIERIQLMHNMQYPSLFLHKHFQLSSVYKVVYGDIVPATPSLSDPNESSARIIYPRCTFTILLERKPGYYVSNVIVPLAVLTLLGPLSNAIESDGSSMGTGDRLSVTLTLILTAVAYKFVVAASLPQVSYLTILDMHVLVCFVFLVANASENVIYPVLVYSDRASSDMEKYFVVAYFALFALFHILYFGAVHIKLRARNAFFEKDILYERTVREVNNVVYQVKLETSLLVGDQVLEEVLKIKNLTQHVQSRDRCKLDALRVMKFNPFRVERVFPVNKSDPSENLPQKTDIDMISAVYLKKVKEK